MASSPAISIIIPVYNAADHIGDLLGDVRAQTFKDFEVICVDDGSTDTTTGVLDQWMQRDSRIRVISKENAGPGIARNTGLDAARGKYVLFFDSDDRIRPQLAQHAIDRARQTQADIVIYQARHLEDATGKDRTSPDRWDGSKWPETFNSETNATGLLQTFRNWPWDKLFRRAFIEDNQLRFPALYRTEDLPFTCEALCLAKTIALLDEELYLYRVGSKNASTQTLDSHPFDFIEACRLFLAFLHDNGLYGRMQREYVNWASLCVLVNLYGLHTWDAFNETLRLLHGDGLQQLELAGQPATMFDYPVYCDLIRSIAADDPTKSVFELWRCERKAQEALRRASHEEGRSQVMDSTTFRVGRALTSLPTALKDRFARN